MPDAASVCFTVKDDDRFLSGDNKCNENADDRSFQTARITDANGAELGNGRQIYAESYHWVSDQHGNWYVLIEIEQEGTGDDYFAFYTGGHYTVPPAGAHLTVHGSCDVRGDWLKFEDLGSGPKPEPEPATGTICGSVFCDTNCDGIDGIDTVEPGHDYVIEAEHMSRSKDMTVFHGSQASGGEGVRLKCAGDDGWLKTAFNGKTGVYDVTIRVQDENDGRSVIKLLVDGKLVEAVRLDRDNNGGGSDNGGFSHFVIRDVAINAHSEIKLVVDGDKSEFVRIDNIQFEGQDKVVRAPEPPKEGVTVFLLNADGSNVIDANGQPVQTVTDAEGKYEFANVPVGDYRVKFVAPDGTVFTSQDAGTDDTRDSDVDSTGVSSVFTVMADEKTDIDAGVAPMPVDAVDDMITVLESEGAGDVDVNVLDNDTPAGETGLVLKVDGQTANVGEWIDLAGGGRVRIDANGELDFDADGDFDGLNAGESEMVSVTYTIGRTTETPADETHLDFNDLARGTVVTNQFAANGLTIASANANNPVMIFDTANPTGGDTDLATSNLGKVLILSEDRDSNDPDDNAGGGTFIFTFDRPADLSSMTFLDTEEPTPVLRFYDAAGDLITTINGPSTTNGGQAVANFDVTGVSRLEVQLKGSGAIDNIKYSFPGETIVKEDTATVKITIEGEDDPVGSLSGRYFCDENRDGVDNGEPGIEGVLVELLDANGNPTGITTTTAADGSYSFSNLAPGTYGVKFTDTVSGKTLIAPNVGNDDAVDSDATDLGGGMSQIRGIVVVSGQDTPDNDAGVEQVNEAPVAMNDLAAVCDGEATTIDVLANDTDAEDGVPTITAIDLGDGNGFVSIVEGQQVTLASGATVTLLAGKFVYDVTGVDAFDDLLVGEMMADSFIYQVSDADGATASAQVDVTVKGDEFTLEMLDEDLGEVGHVTGRLFASATGDADGFIYDFEVESVENPASRLGEVLSGLDPSRIELTFCLSINSPIDFAPALNEFSIDLLDADSFSAALAGATPLPGSFDFGLNPQNVDNVAWLINETEALLAEGFTEGNIQRAIWNLINGGPNNVLTGGQANNFFASQPQYGSAADALELTNRALANDGFVAGEGDIVTLILDPKEALVQPLVIGIEFETLRELCDCDSDSFAWM